MLNNRQRAQLRGLANTLQAIGQIGKEGISNNLVGFLDDALESHELVKIHILKTSPTSLNELSIELSRLLHCEVVQVIGNTMVIYRESREHKRIKLVR